MVRCGACRTEFDAPGEGRHACPTCGAINQVSAAPRSTDEAPSPTPPSAAPPAAPSTPTSPITPGAQGVVPEPPGIQPEAAAPPNEVQCSECEFEFFVGDIEVASCPNCGTEVKV